MNIAQQPLFNFRAMTLPRGVEPRQTVPAISTNSESQRRIQSPLANPHKSLENALQSIFPERSGETRTEKARGIMGEAVRAMPDEELDTYLTEFQFLIDNWLDAYEKGVFNGQTLQQVLREE